EQAGIHVFRIPDRRRPQGAEYVERDDGQAAGWLSYHHPAASRDQPDEGDETRQASRSHQSLLFFSARVITSPSTVGEGATPRISMIVGAMSMLCTTGILRLCFKLGPLA